MEKNLLSYKVTIARTRTIELFFKGLKILSNTLKKSYYKQFNDLYIDTITPLPDRYNISI